MTNAKGLESGPFSALCPVIVACDRTWSAPPAIYLYSSQSAFVQHCRDSNYQILIPAIQEYGLSHYGDTRLPSASLLCSSRLQSSLPRAVKIVPDDQETIARHSTNPGQEANRSVQRRVSLLVLHDPHKALDIVLKM